MQQTFNVNKNQPVEKKRLAIHQPKLPSTAKMHAQVSSTSLPTPPADVLLKALHDAISLHQVYPASAIALNQSGEIEVSFTLQPNGLITDLRILKSTGFDALDQAGLAAIQAAEPFAIAASLHQTTRFSLTIAFG